MKQVTMKFMSGHISAPTRILQLFLVVRAGSGDNDLLRRDDERALCGGSAVEHLLHHGLEGADHFTLGDVLRRALDLIALEILRIVNRNCDPAAAGAKVFQRRVQEHIADDQLSVRRHILERNRHHIWFSVGTGSQIPHPALEQLHNVFIQHDKFLLVF